MNDITDEERAMAHRRGLHWSAANLGGTLAVAISIFALVLGAYQTRLMQSQARAGARSFLTMATPTAAIPTLMASSGASTTMASVRPSSRRSH